MNPIFLMILATLPLGASSPDPPEAMFAHISQNLKAGRFAEAKVYTQAMLHDYPGYVPAVVADAELRCMESGSPDQYAKLLRMLDATLDKHRKYYPPMFENEIKSELQRCGSLGRLIPGATVESISKWRELPLNFVTLLLLSPMVGVSDITDSAPVSYKRHLLTPDRKKDLETKLDSFVESLLQPRYPTAEDLEQVEALSQLPMDKGLPALLKVLDAFNPLLPQTAAETMSEYGVAAEPAILASMSRALISESQMCHIYALVRIGEYNSAIEKTLSTGFSGNPSVQQYALKSLEFLSKRAGQGAAPVK